MGLLVFLFRFILFMYVLQLLMRFFVYMLPRIFMFFARRQSPRPSASSQQHSQPRRSTQSDPERAHAIDADFHADTTSS